MPLLGGQVNPFGSPGDHGPAPPPTARQVESLYVNLLGRQPGQWDPAAIQAWVNSGQSIDVIAQQIAGSPEGQSRLQPLAQLPMTPASATSTTFARPPPDDWVPSENTFGQPDANWQTRFFPSNESKKGRFARAIDPSQEFKQFAFSRGLSSNELSQIMGNYDPANPISPERQQAIAEAMGWTPPLALDRPLGPAPFPIGPPTVAPPLALDRPLGPAPFPIGPPTVAPPLALDRPLGPAPFPIGPTSLRLRDTSIGR